MPLLPDIREIPDPDLTEQAIAGCKDSLGELVRRHSSKTATAVMRIAKNYEDALDDVAEASRITVYKISEFRAECSFRTWFQHIAVNVCLSRMRREHRHKPVQLVRVDYVRDKALSPEALCRQNEVVSLVSREIRRLPKNQRVASKLRYIDGMAVVDIAALMGESEQNTKTRVYRGIHTLRERLRDRL